MSTFTGGLLVPFVPEVGAVILRTGLEVVLIVGIDGLLHFACGVLDAACRLEQGTHVHCHLNGSGLHILLFHVDC